MAIRSGHALLDQLQSQVNLVLEQAGRVFAAVNTNARKPPTAQVNKLKQILPKAQVTFHEALDQLEDELHLAQLVIRRDLALFREKSGYQMEAPVTTQITRRPLDDAQSGSPLDEKVISADHKHIENQPVRTGDAIMHDAQPEQQSVTANQDQSRPAINEPVPVLQSDAIDTKAMLVTDVTDKEPDQPQAQNEDETQNQPGTADAKTTNSSLQLDTASSDIETDKAPEDEKAPDTAKESINDLDSLFGAGDTNTNEPNNNDFTFDENTTGDIDFGDFTTFNTDNGDNDNISSLLPGLQDYANTHTGASGAELDLSSFFNTNPADQNNATNQQGASEQRDTTFDDLMDLANFDGSAMGDEANNTGDMDFESFFN